MKKYAVYGKGGIGKSTITSSLSAAIAGMGYTVMQIGCDPKADSTANLLNGKKQTSVMSYLNQYDEAPTLEDIVVQGYNGVYCVEAGGPTPGIGCAGRGIIATFNLLEELRAPLADRFVVTQINLGIFTGKDFLKKENGAVFMTDDARKRFLSAWQKRKQETIVHPYLKEKIPWGMAAYAQALLLARYLRGDLDAYPPFLWK